MLSGNVRTENAIVENGSDQNLTRRVRTIGSIAVSFAADDLISFDCIIFSNVAAIEAGRRSHCRRSRPLLKLLSFRSAATRRQAASDKPQHQV
ncbi:hypothetical protein Mal52_30560 [Symmachiella dynata]|uniref:Uncharacterized protein n=1 Tax=Symmachiella dynata TaxID=2527995 RepID=A0A517ZQ09_9PLAN|nr:hypothetical protein Mal52_30560 [Symmachiella dynata]